jgi:YegS/Rv2252/BmrU family lipid kinase
MKTAVIVNPRSAGGRTGRRWTAVAETLAARLGPVETRFTERPGHGIVLTRALLEEGFDRIIAAGGDGTINEVANGFLDGDRPVRPQAALGVLPLGTGGDFRRTLGAPEEPHEAVEALARSEPRLLDVGKAVFRGWDGRRHVRYFVNLVSFGMGGEVASRAQNVFSHLGGKAAFLWATLAAFFRYRSKQVRLRLDGAEAALPFEIYNVAVGNGRFHGGGMQVCPTADPYDGLLEVTVIEYLRRRDAIRDLPVLYSDNVYQHPKVRHLRGRRLIAESLEEVRIEVDGEPLGALPLEISVLPGCVAVLQVPPGRRS